MKYRSTRGGVAGLSFKDAVIMGLADDGGLLVPHELPDVSDELDRWQELDYAGLACEVMSRFIDDLPKDELKSLIDASYATFDHPLVTPLVNVGDLHILELFHGPTLAFKDVALQFLGNVFEYILTERGAFVNILGATSGDTGSAAIAGVRGKANINIYVMFPEGKTSPIQERQMTTILDDNVHNIAVEGSFDDCQRIMKEIFSDLAFKEHYSLAAVNSVNWARVLAQIVYYFSAWYQLGRPQTFDVAVPTGNFGNIFAGFCAREMGLPIRHLVLATNENDILCRFFNEGVYQRGDVQYTFSPAMDIQVSSNFERYLYYKLGRSEEKVKAFMNRFLSTGQETLHFNTERLDAAFLAGAVSNAETLDTIRSVNAETDYLVDPHTAVGITVGRRFRTDDVPLLCLATAHPAKFEEAIREALPDIDVSHPTLTKLAGLPVRKTLLKADVDTVKRFIEIGGRLQGP
ncbi:MAG: threonine synthase [Pseudomonadales bacterium]